jgi:hypothetical protein
VQLDFSPWYRWSEREHYPGFKYPGIYILAISQDDLSGLPFSFRPEIVYIGMTNSQYGLDGRLWQFEQTISRRQNQHGGADRVLYKHREYASLTAGLYAALWHVECSASRDTPHDLRCMGKVAQAEYECWARCKEELGALPEFNRKKDSPKYTKLVEDF